MILAWVVVKRWRQVLTWIPTLLFECTSDPETLFSCLIGSEDLTTLSLFLQTLDYDDYKRRASMERKRVYLPGLDFLFGMLYIASVGFLVRNREGKFRRPKW